MTNLNSRSALHPRWTYAPLDVLRAFEAVVIAIFAPNNAEPGPSDYDPWASRRTPPTPGGGNETQTPTILWQGPAQMQVYRQSLTVDDVAGSVTQLRSVRFTMDMRDTDFIIRKGMIVRILSSKFDTQDTLYEYTVTSGANSALAWKRTIEAESDMMVVAPPITDYNA